LFEGANFGIQAVFFIGECVKGIFQFVQLSHIAGAQFALFAITPKRPKAALGLLLALIQLIAFLFDLAKPRLALIDLVIGGQNLG